VKPADLSRGTRLVADASGWEYIVTGETDGRIVLRGPNGRLTVSRDALRRDIAAGKVVVR
jgi:hypothetical protein